MSGIPSVDLRDFISGNEERKQKFVREIGKAFEEIGFVALSGHFLSDELVTELYSEVKAFFELPQEIKDSYEVPGIGGQRAAHAGAATRSVPAGGRLARLCRLCPVCRC